MSSIYKLFGMEWPPLQAETPLVGEPEPSTPAVADKPSTPKLEQARTDFSKEKSTMERNLTEVGEEIKVCNRVLSFTR